MEGVIGLRLLKMKLQAYLDKLVKAGAISFETRKSPNEIKLPEKELTMLVKMRLAKMSSDGKYYAVETQVLK